VAVNVAIHRDANVMTIHRVDPAKAASVPRGEKSKGIASFSATHHQGTNTPAGAMITESVKCTTLNALFASQGITELDLLQIDAEGYDAEIVDSIDFAAIKPKIIRFEHVNMSELTLAALRKRLDAAGYELMIEPYDVTAYQPRIVLNA
jgi:hypothetical protein